MDLYQRTQESGLKMKEENIRVRQKTETHTDYALYLKTLDSSIRWKAYHANCGQFGGMESFQEIIDQDEANKRIGVDCSLPPEVEAQYNFECGEDDYVCRLFHWRNGVQQLRPEYTQEDLKRAKAIFKKRWDAGIFGRDQIWPEADFWNE